MRRAQVRDGGGAAGVQEEPADLGAVVTGTYPHRYTAGRWKVGGFGPIVDDENRERLGAKLLGNIRADVETGCWEWTKSRVGWAGYGRIYLDSAYELFIGPIPPGLLVCHRCDNPPCCNPAHLFVGTYQDNSDDAKAKGHIGRRR